MQKKGVLAVTAVLVICGLLFCNANAVVEAQPLSTTALTISAPPSAQVSQSFSITGTLTANGLPGKTITLQREDPSGK